MGLKERLLEDVKNAMKAKDADRLAAIRFLQSAIKYREIEMRPNPMQDQDILAVVQKLVKQRQDSIAEFEKAGRQDLVDKEKAELAILQEYLPKQLSTEELTQVVTDVIAALGATGMKQMGAVIKEVQARTAGAADNRAISEIVKAKLQS